MWTISKQAYEEMRKNNHFRCQWCGTRFSDRIGFTAHKRSCRRMVAEPR